MRYTSFCLLTVLLAGCPTRARLHGNDGGDGVDGRGSGGTAGDARDGAPGDAADGTPRDAADGAPGDVGDGTQGDAGDGASISIISPASMTYANGDVIVQVRVSGGTPATVQLLRNDVAWQQIPSPYRYMWDTKPAPEGDYILTATATIGGHVVTSAPVIVSVDRTAPMVTDLTPVRGNVTVDSAEQIHVTFSEPVVPATVTNAAVQLTAGGAAIASGVKLAADATSLTVTIADRQAIALPAAFAGTVATTITDRAGNPLAPLAPAWTWIVPAWLKRPPLPSELPPRLAIGADRRPVLLYVTQELVSGTYVEDVRVARLENEQWNTSMGSPTTTRDTATSGYSLALDSQGQPVVAWTEHFSQFDVHVGAWSGTSWTLFPALDAINDVGRDGSLPSVRVDGSGRPVVVWKEMTGTGPTYDVFAARWGGTAWTRLNGTGIAGGANLAQVLDGPQLVLDAQGNPIFGWLSGGGIGSSVSTWTGTDWARSQGLIGGFTPYPALDAAGAPLVAAKSTDLHVLKAGASWTEVTSTPLTTSSSWNAPRLALAPDGSPVVAWVDTSSGVRLGVARWTGTAWDTRFGLFNAGQNPANTIVPELVVDAKGSVWVAWMEGTAIQVWMSNY